jgi:perosamine synthetase
MTGYQAAMGLVQCKKIEEIIAEKIRVAKAYHLFLSKVDGLQLPVAAKEGRHVYWMYGVVVQPEFGITRDELQTRLRDAGIDTRTFFCPMNLQPTLQKQPGYRRIECPVAESLWNNGLYLPSSPTLSEKTIQQIAETISQIAATSRAKVTA